MRSAGFWTGIAGVLFAALTASMPSEAQQYVPAEVNSSKISNTAKIGNAAAVASATQPGATQAKSAKPPAQAKPATAPAAARSAAVSPVLPATHGPSQVFLLKGLADVFSSGMDKLAIRLKQAGVPARVASHASSDTLADEVIARYRAGVRSPVVIAGHSLGADAAVNMSQRLNEAKVPVALVITFGPVGFPRVMGNVARAVNYYQANSAWHGQVVRGDGFKGSLTNIDLENALDVNHFNIEKVDRIQAEAIGKIVSAIGGARRAPAPAATTAAATGEASPAATSATSEQKPADGTTATGPATPARQN